MEGYVVFRRLVSASSGTLIMVHELYGTGTQIAWYLYIAFTLLVRSRYVDGKVFVAIR